MKKFSLGSRILSLLLVLAMVFSFYVPLIPRAEAAAVVGTRENTGLGSGIDMKSTIS